MMLERVAVIGAGPGGIAAAIQLQRYGLEPVLFEKADVGGLLRNANCVENYPGFPGGCSGLALVERLAQHLAVLGVQVNNQEVTLLDLAEKGFAVHTQAGVRYFERVVLASGTQPLKVYPGLIDESALGRVFYEIIPLLAERGRKFVIVGAGDAAFDYALNLSRHNHVLILNRGHELRCLPLLWERAKRVENIVYHPGYRLIAARCAGDGQKVDLTVEASPGKETLQADYLIFAIGRRPQLGFLSKKVQAQAGDLVAAGHLFMAGDVKNDLFRQAAIAAGDGLQAAMHIYHLVSASIRADSA